MLRFRDPIRKATVPSPLRGTLVLDATVCPPDVRYPQDVSLLDEAREKLEAIVDDLCEQGGYNRPRTYRRVARRDFLNWSKSRRKGPRFTRKALRKQLGHVERDLGYVQDLVASKGCELTDKQEQQLETIVVLAAQQREMYEQRKHKVGDRVVSIEQPWVRPVVRGKAHDNTEFGAKLHLSVEDGLARVEHVGFGACPEASRLADAAEGYRESHGRWPERILADKACRTRRNLRWCRERGIRLSGPKLGKRSTNAEKRRESAKDRKSVV